jgi:hypothetical protein
MAGRHNQSRHNPHKGSKISFKLGDSEIVLSKVGMVKPEDLPPPPDGYVRLYTTLDNSSALPSVEDNGKDRILSNSDISPDVKELIKTL